MPYGCPERPLLATGSRRLHQDLDRKGVELYPAAGPGDWAFLPAPGGLLASQGGLLYSVRAASG